MAARRRRRDATSPQIYRNPPERTPVITLLTKPEHAQETRAMSRRAFAWTAGSGIAGAGMAGA
jgi:hypothetical protein